MKRITLAAAICLAPISVLAADVTIETATGETAVETGPDTVVALDLAAIDTLAALGVELDGVPDITPPAHLASAMEGVPTVGTLFEPDFEALAAMGPDLIVAGGRSQPQIEPLSRIAPTIDMTFLDGNVISQAKARAQAYGAVFGIEGKAQEEIQDLDKALAAAQAAVANKGDALILMANGGALSAYGEESRFGWLHTDLGLPEAYADVSAGSHGQSVSFEFVAEVNPDWIIVIDRGAAIGRDGEAAAVTLDNPLVAGTSAGQNGHIVYIDSAAMYLSSGGLQSLELLLGEITQAFNQGES